MSRLTGQRLLAGIAAVACSTALAMLALPAIAAPPATHGGGAPSSFALIGDTPYGPQQTAEFPRMIADINRDPDVGFVLHAGDTKSGGTLCSDELLTAKRDLYNTFADPFVITPGDNDWTDCHRVSNGQYLPTERLDFFRSLYYAQPDRSLGKSLGRHPMAVRSQAQVDPALADRVENQLFVRSRVVFSTVHVVGSNNDLAPWSGLEGGDRPDLRLAEYAARQAANLAWLDATFAQAAQTNAAGVFLLLQANPLIELPDDDPAKAGFLEFLAAFKRHAAAFGGPVVLAHGDFHELLIDQPFADLPNVTRVQTFGEQIDQWIRVGVDPRAAGVFSFAPVQVAAP